MTQARRWAAEVVATVGYEPFAPTVELLVAELASNAVRYSNADHFDVEVDANGQLLIAVCDPSPTLPPLRRAEPADLGGRGLAILDELAPRWGIKRRRTGKCLWFALDGPPAAS